MTLNNEQLILMSVDQSRDHTGRNLRIFDPSAMRTDTCPFTLTVLQRLTADTAKAMALTSALQLNGSDAGHGQIIGLQLTKLRDGKPMQKRKINRLFVEKIGLLVNFE